MSHEIPSRVNRPMVKESLYVFLFFVLAAEPSQGWNIATAPFHQRTNLYNRRTSQWPLAQSSCSCRRHSKTALASRLVNGKIVINEGADEIQPKKKQRCFDFPPYYYKELNNQNEKNKTMRVKISSNAENQIMDERITKRSKSPIESFTFRVLETVEKSAIRTRLLDDRSYGKKELFNAANLDKPPSLDDIAGATTKGSWVNTFWISTPARLGTFVAAYFSFPFLSQVFNTFVTMQPDQLDDITSKFGPTIAILYGTFVSLTLSILYERQRKIQESVALEASLLVFMTRTMLALFRDNKTRAIDGCQCTADQIRTLVTSSRGEELMLIMYSDPYSRMLDSLDEYEESVSEPTRLKKAGLLAAGRDAIKDLMRVRASRLSDEALALPPTHFLVLNLLTCLILISYIISTLPTTDRLGAPSNESSLIFGILTTIYVLFYFFASDLNEPFTGVYQVRRSTAATHMLEAKWLLANYPHTRGEIDFEKATQEPDSDGVLIRSPGIGEVWFERDDLFVDGKDSSTLIN